MFSGNAGLIVNCGFARTAIYQLYSKQPPRSKTSKQSRPQPEKENEQSTSSKSPPQSDVDVSMLNGEYNSVECETDDSPHFECNNTDVDVITHSNESSFSTSYTVDAAMQPEMLHGGSGPVNETRAISKNPLQVFKEYFANICNLDKSDFKADTKKQSRFDRHVKKVLAAFRSKWHPTQARIQYIETFSLEKWHSISNCIACAMNHEDLQAAIPLKPIFNYKGEENCYGASKKVATVTEKEFVKTHFEKFNSFCKESTGKPFVEIAINHMGPIKKVLQQTKNETMKNCKLECNIALAKNAVINAHSQDISYSKHNRQRLMTYFNKPQSTPKRVVTRTPLSEKDCQSSEQFSEICDKLRNWDATDKFSATDIANQFNIKRTDATHKIKLLALDLKANIPDLKIISKPKSTLKRFTNSQVTMPAPPNCKKLKKQEKELIETNVISGGIPCCPLPVTYYKNGEKYEKTATGRKFSLLEVREKLLAKHVDLM